MANETPNRVHAGGIFVPVVAEPFTSNILNSQAVQEFTRLGPGQYRITLQRPLAFAEGYPEAGLPANFQGVAGAQLAPDGASVLVTVLSLASGEPVDPPLVMCTVWSVREGEGEGPSIPLPGIPPPLPGTGNAVIFFSPQESMSQDTYRVRQIPGSGAFDFSGAIPADFVSLVSIGLVIDPLVTLVDADIDLASSYGALAESTIATQETETLIEFNVTAGIWSLCPLESVFATTGLKAGDFLGVQVDHQNIGNSVDYLYLRVEYGR
jgi:hypothetical protein